MNINSIGYKMTFGSKDIPIKVGFGERKLYRDTEPTDSFQRSKPTIGEVLTKLVGKEAMDGIGNMSDNELVDIASKRQKQVNRPLRHRCIVYCIKRF